MSIDIDGMCTDDVEAAQGILEDILIESTSADNSNEALGGVVSSVITGCTGFVTGLLTLFITFRYAVDAFIGALAATTIMGPYILISALLANFLEEDISDDGSTNDSFVSSEQYANIGVGALNDYTALMGEQILSSDREIKLLLEFLDKISPSKEVKIPPRKKVGKVKYKMYYQEAPKPSRFEPICK